MEGCFMKVLSLFDRISCAQIALNRNNINNYTYYASEIDKYAISVAQRNYPNTIQLGDVNSIRTFNDKVDLLIGGSPCQGFSRAGTLGGFDDPRSALFWKFIACINIVQPRYFFLENVVMRKEWKDIITNALGVEPIQLNSSLVSAQNRNRLYWTNIPIKSPPQNKFITFNSIREHNAKRMYYSISALHWIAKQSLAKNKLLTVYGDLPKMQMVETSHYKKYSLQRFFGIVDTKQEHTWNSSNKDIYIDNGALHFAGQKISNSFNHSPEFSLRFTTPLECERLQTIPDNYTSNLSDTQRFKCIGNAFTVDIIAHFLQYFA